MEIYTSYWAMVRNFPKNLIGLNTTIFSPKWRPLGQDKRGIWVIDCPPFKPGPQCDGLCRGECEPKHPDDCEFLKVYRNQLDDINVEEFLTKLEKLAAKFKENEHLNEVDFALIVYEAPQNMCSERRPILEWVAFTGLNIKEWKKT